jgi:prefoldin alpha subunit
VDIEHCYQEATRMSQEDGQAMSRDLEMGLAQMEQMKAQIDALRSQVASLQSILLDHSNSIDVLKGLEGQDENEVLMPIGGSAYLKVKVIDGSSCIVDRGAGVHVDTPVKDTIELIEKRMGSIRGGISSIESTINELLTRYDDISRRTQELYSKQMAAGAGPENTF